MDLSPDELAFLSALESQLQVHAADQRSFERLPLALEVHLDEPGGQHLEGRTLDISHGGLRARFDEAPQLGVHYDVLVHGLEASPLRCSGRCLRATLGPDGGAEATLRFSEPVGADGPLG